MKWNILAKRWRLRIRGVAALRTRRGGQGSFFRSALTPALSQGRGSYVAGLLALCMMVPLLAGCDRMKDQPRYNTEAPSDYYPDGASARPIVYGTVARGQGRTDELFYQGKVNGKLSTVLPFPMKVSDLQRGREQFNIYCAVCHGKTGHGNGMIAQRGFIQPPSFHIQRLREEPIGHFFDVVTNGWGAMYSYAARVAPVDRWRIAMYIRALQLSQSVKVGDLSPEDRRQLQESMP